MPMIIVNGPLLGRAVERFPTALAVLTARDGSRWVALNESLRALGFPARERTRLATGLLHSLERETARIAAQEAEAVPEEVDDAPTDRYVEVLG